MAAAEEAQPNPTTPPKQSTKLRHHPSNFVEQHVLHELPEYRLTLRVRTLPRANVNDRTGRCSCEGSNDVHGRLKRPEPPPDRRVFS